MEEPKNPQIAALFIGTPKQYDGEEGPWQSSIGRTVVKTVVHLSENGLAGDKVADTKNHGSLDQAVCCHTLAHFGFWNQEFGLIGTSKVLLPGSIGENWTLSGCDETTVCIGDIYQVGTAVVQVSQPRAPCWKQEAKTGVQGLLERTINSLKTGFYVRVLQPGDIKAGDDLILQHRLNPGLTVADIANCRFHEGDLETTLRAAACAELSEGWRTALAEGERGVADSRNSS